MNVTLTLDTAAAEYLLERLGGPAFIDSLSSDRERRDAVSYDSIVGQLERGLDAVREAAIPIGIVRLVNLRADVPLAYEVTASVGDPRRAVQPVTVGRLHVGPDGVRSWHPSTGQVIR